MGMGRLVESDLSPNRAARQCTFYLVKGLLRRPQHKPGPLPPQHGERSHELHTQEVGHQTATPRDLPNSWKVLSFLKPSIRNASRCRVRPSMVLMINAVVKRLLVRAAWVR